MARRPIALTNWKMAMTVEEALAYAQELRSLAGEWLERVDVVICPSYTAIWPLAQEMYGGPLALGAQDIAESAESEQTGRVSARQVAEAGASYVMLGHAEIRRDLGDTDEKIKAKLELALAAGLRPILLLGDEDDEGMDLHRRLDYIVEGGPEDLQGAVLVYEPERSIGASEHAPMEAISAGVRQLRSWAGGLEERSGESLRVIYGGGVTVEDAPGLMEIENLDGLGATTAARTPAGFARLIEVVGRSRLAR